MTSHPKGECQAEHKTDFSMMGLSTAAILNYFVASLATVMQIYQGQPLRSILDWLWGHMCPQTTLFDAQAKQLQVICSKLAYGSRIAFHLMGKSCDCMHLHICKKKFKPIQTNSLNNKHLMQALCVKSFNTISAHRHQNIKSPKLFNSRGKFSW